MPQISVLDSTGATQVVAKVGNTGTDADSNSLPVAFSTEGKAQLGSTTETAPSNDTTGSGLNGRLQRIAQRLTTMLGVLPAGLGTTTDSASTPVAFSTEGKAQFGAATEASPGTDTASSGLNGRLQRIAQRLTSLIALTPALGTSADSAASPVAFSTEGKAQLGSLTETAPGTDTASSGLNGRLQRIAQNLTTVNTTLGGTNAQLPPTPSGSVAVTITRPANTTPYTAGDVLGGALTIASGLSSGQRCILTSMDLMPQIGSVPAGMTSFRLHLYNVTPPSATADNGVWDLPSGDRASYLGYVDVGTPVDLGSTLFVQTDGVVNKQLQLSGSANFFGYLVTNAGFTPAGNSEVYQLRAHFVGL